MKTIYFHFWWKSGDARGECYQAVDVNDLGQHTLAGYVDHTGAPVTIPEPHEGVIVNARAPLDRPPHMPLPAIQESAPVAFNETTNATAQE